MEQLKQAILSKGVVVDSAVLKVDQFLNHQIDPALMDQIGRAFAERFAADGITRVMTIETSGIAPALFTGLHLQVPVLFAKKNESLTLGKDVYCTEVRSFTKQKVYRIAVEKNYLTPQDRILLVDDFLAAGQALNGLIELVSQAGAKTVGAGIVVEKGFQHGGDQLRQQGMRVESLAIIESMDGGKIIFRDAMEV